MNAKVIAIVSIGANVALVGVLAHNGLFRSTPVAPVTEPSSPPETAPAQATPAVVASKFDWHTVESPDYRTYIANLRSIGCPEETIRDIISADVKKMLEARIPPTKTRRFEYWKASSYFNVIDEDRLARRKELSQQRRALLKELLGINTPEKVDLMGGINPFEIILDFLPPEKLAPMAEIEQKYGTRLSKTMTATSMGDFTETKGTLAAKDAEVAALLTPEEKFEYDLRLSQTASMLRMRLGDVEVNENEYRELYKAQKSFDDQYGLPGMQASDKMAAINTAQKQLNSQFKSILGEDRFRDFFYAADYAPSGLKALAEENNIPKATVMKVFDVIENAQTQVMALRQNTSLTIEQRRESLRQLRASVDQQINSYLGPAGPAFIIKNPWVHNFGLRNTQPQ